MLDQVLDSFRIVPDFKLSIMKPNQSLSDIASSVFSALDSVIEKTKPDFVLVQGDTTTASIAAMCAYYHKVPVGHIEAGLRTWDLYQPFPEEGNRRLISSISSLHFAPTEWSKKNLLRENVTPSKIKVTGNSSIDALFYILQNTTTPKHSIFEKINKYTKTILVTAHRRESFGQTFQEICHAIQRIALQYPTACIVYPVHLNPNVQKPVHDILKNIPNIFLIDPLDHVTFVHLMSKSSLIMTDSGGIQEEAPTLRIPVLLMREKTERPEGVQAGVVFKVGTKQNNIFKMACKILDSKIAYKKMKKNPYGDGKTSQKIMSILERALQE